MSSKARNANKFIDYGKLSDNYIQISLIYFKLESQMCGEKEITHIDTENDINAVWYTVTCSAILKHISAIKVDISFLCVFHQAWSIAWTISKLHAFPHQHSLRGVIKNSHYGRIYMVWLES